MAKYQSSSENKFGIERDYDEHAANMCLQTNKKSSKEEARQLNENS